MQWVQLPSALVLTRKGLQLLENLENSEMCIPQQVVMQAAFVLPFFVLQVTRKVVLETISLKG